MQNYCDTKAMSLKAIYDALTNETNVGDKIVVPRFQRGKRWNKEQKKTFVNSINQGFPVGSLLFYERNDNGRKIYVLVDGLQRGSCIKEYVQKPNEYLEIEDIPEDLCLKLASALSISDHKLLMNPLLEAIRNYSTSDKLTTFVRGFLGGLNLPSDCKYDAFEVQDLLEDFVNTAKSHADDIASVTIPVIVYSGPESNLHIIFDRINSKGTPLSPYEIYAASWPDDRYYIQSDQVVSWYNKKDIQYRKDGINLDDHNAEEYMVTHKLSIFEFMFGFSKYIVNTYPILNFNKKLKDDEINPLGFELVDACLNSSNQISTLYQKLKDINMNDLQDAIEKSIDFVSNAVKSVSDFKGNNRNSAKVFHSKFQIMSMIASVFNTKYSIVENSIKESPDWIHQKSMLEKNLLHYYIYDIIERTWFEGGTSKIYRYVRENLYLKSISDDAWARCLESYYGKSLENRQEKKFKNPSNEDYVILNAIYMSIFTAQNQNGTEKYDVEHIAPKEQMRTLISTCKCQGLAVSSIANLCYLPEDANRKKQSKNFYQDENYLGDKLTLQEVEEKYSFTQKADLDWMDFNYKEETDPSAKLEQKFRKYLDERFNILRKKFCSSMQINYAEE